MSGELGAFGAWRRVSEITPEMAVGLEQLGYGAIWIGGSPGGHLDDVEEILAATERIPVVTGIVNMWREDAETVARSYHRIAGRHPGRFLLGVGVGHREATAEYDRPYEKMVGYLDRLDSAGVSEDTRILAALGPRALALAASRTAGAHPYLTTPRHTLWARGLMGAGPLLAPEHKVIIDTDADRARSAGRSAVARYLRLVNYRNNLRREGWTEDDLADGGSDRLVDALVLHGDVEGVAAGLRAHLDAGADHVGIQVLGDDSVDGYRQLAEALID